MTIRLSTIPDDPRGTHNDAGAIDLDRTEKAGGRAVLRGPLSFSIGLTSCDTSQEASLVRTTYSEACCQAARHS